MQKITIVLPFPLPTWNRVLAMHHWQRKKLRDALHELVCIFTPIGKDSLTPMEYQRKLLSTESLRQEYYLMIRPSSSNKSATVRKRRQKRKR